MTSNKPYLLRALYEWISDNGCTPYILVNALVLGCEVPQAHVKDGQIILNIMQDVVHDLILGNEAIEFTARFSDVATKIYIPIAAITAIYAKENGKGMAFPEEAVIDEDEPPTPPRGTRGRPDLKLVK